MLPPIHEPLVSRLSKGKCVLFAGAGLSAPAGLPSWNKLLYDTIAWAERSRPGAVDKNELELLLQKGKLLAAGDGLLNGIGRDGIAAAFREILSGENVAPTPLHRLIAQLPFAAIITTNYDQLIERSYAGPVNVVTQNDATKLAECLDSGAFFVLKPHGDLARPETIVLAQEDYDRLTLSNDALWTAISTLVLTHAVVFAGYSLEDPDFQLFFARLTLLFGKAGAPRYALMKGLSATERRMLNNKSISVLAFDEYSEVPEFFRLLSQAVARPATEKETNSAPVPPSPMASDLRWSLKTPNGEEPVPGKTVIVTRFEQGGAAELEALLLDARPEVASALIEHVGTSRYEALRSQAVQRVQSRGADRPTVVVIPGFMGSELEIRKQYGKPTMLWISPWQLMMGRFQKLTFGEDLEGGWVYAARPYRRFMDYAVARLRQRFNVLVFPWDWRRGYLELSDDLASFITENTAAGAPVNIVALSSGGLIARALMIRHPKVWNALQRGNGGAAAEGGRLILLGTPNHGSFASVMMLLGRDPTMRLLSMLDLRHDLEELRRIYATFPSVYQMLPSPLRNSIWEPLYDEASYGGLQVSGKQLAQAREFHETLAGAVDPNRMVCIFGHGTDTTSDVQDPHRLQDPGAWVVTPEGDGVVAHASAGIETGGRPVTSYFVKEAHGTLLTNGQVIDAIGEIILYGCAFHLPTDPKKPMTQLTPEERLSDSPTV